MSLHLNASFSYIYRTFNSLTSTWGPFTFVLPIRGFGGGLRRPCPS